MLASGVRTHLHYVSHLGCVDTHSHSAYFLALNILSTVLLNTNLICLQYLISTFAFYLTWTIFKSCL